MATECKRPVPEFYQTPQNRLLQTFPRQIPEKRSVGATRKADALDRAEEPLLFSAGEAKSRFLDSPHSLWDEASPEMKGCGPFFSNLLWKFPLSSTSVHHDRASSFIFHARVVARWHD
jgi:hypothetical protein